MVLRLPRIALLLAQLELNFIKRSLFAVYDIFRLVATGVILLLLLAHFERGYAVMSLDASDLSNSI